ncbi:unnamed protein product [Symbiodinium sp. CCMP2456]|nr:unnamed protein product [Symbiodinium sp. CCMP2456]
MNGLRSAPLSWYHELAEFLRSQNFEPSLDPTIFRRLTKKGLIIVLFYVDDLLIYSEDPSEGRKFYEELRRRYKLKLTGELLQEYGITKPENVRPFGLGSSFEAAPDEAAENCMRDCLRWIKGLPHKVQRFPSQREILEDDLEATSISCFTDASWSVNSVSGGVLTWKNCALKTYSRKQTTTALSSAESELAALTEVAREGLYIALLVETIREGMPQDREHGYYLLQGYSDSESAICISKMQTLLRKVRHIELRAAFLQELVLKGRFTLEHIPGTINPADALTKSPTNENLASLYDSCGLVDEPKAWDSEPSGVHVSFEEPNESEHERFTPSIPTSWKAAALKLARGEARYVVVELCCEEGSALSKACSKFSEIAYFGVTKEIDLLSYNGLCLLREVFGVLWKGSDVKVYAHLSTPCSSGCGLRHLRFRKGGKALEKWRAALAVHKRSWKRIEKLLEHHAGNQNLLLSHEWPERSGLWGETVFRKVAKKLRLDQGCLVDRCCFEKGNQRPWKRWYFVSNRSEFVWGLASQCSEAHDHYHLSLVESGVYPPLLGIALLKNAKKTFEEK